MLRLHRFIREHANWIIATVVFLLILCLGAQYDVRLGCLIAVIDTVWIVLAKWVFDSFFRSNFFRRSQTLLNICVIFLLISCATLTMMFVEKTVGQALMPDRMPEIERIYIVVRDGFWIICTFLASLVLYSEQNIAHQQALASAKNDLEFKLLRSQISPHFIFNALNNIYSMVYLKDEKAPETILQLSEMLRYTVDFCRADEVEVTKECDYIENYIRFQQAHTGRAGAVRFRHDIRDRSLCIPPMLLQPFVENCFIHGDLSPEAVHGIDITLDVDSEKLEFTTVNAKRHTALPVRKTRESTGIANVRQRLQLYYKDHYSLLTEDGEQLFRVVLQINFPKP
ncbi:MAG: histidine kinase [Bacteroidales bacterium]|nr:histidine kinase [Bacteroidales bacterium]